MTIKITFKNRAASILYLVSKLNNSKNLTDSVLYIFKLPINKEILWSQKISENIENLILISYNSED
jgi:hypothetical protein